MNFIIGWPKNCRLLAILGHYYFLDASATSKSSHSLVNFEKQCTNKNFIPSHFPGFCSTHQNQQLLLTNNNGKALVWDQWLRFLCTKMGEWYPLYFSFTTKSILWSIFFLSLIWNFFYDRLRIFWVSTWLSLVTFSYKFLTSSWTLKKSFIFSFIAERQIYFSIVLF